MKAPKYLNAGIERLATVVARSESAVGRPAAGRTVPRTVDRRVVGAGRDGGSADLQDRRTGERDDDARRDLEVDGLLAEARDGRVDAAGGHHRRADGQPFLERLRLGLDLLALTSRHH